MLSRGPSDRLEAELQPAVNLSEDFLEILILREKPAGSEGRLHSQIRDRGYSSVARQLHHDQGAADPKILGELLRQGDSTPTLQERASVTFSRASMCQGSVLVPLYERFSLFDLTVDLVRQELDRLRRGRF
jgi:hypothetical protein